MSLNPTRRAVLAAAAAIAAAPASAAEQRTGPQRVAIFAGNTRSLPQWVAFDGRLRELGDIGGTNVAVDFVIHAEMTPAELKNALVETVRRGAAVIVAAGPERMLKAAMEATRDVPIVMIAIDYDPLAKGYIAGLAHPGGNVTGVFLQQIELASKRLELFRGAVPNMARIVVLWDAVSADQFAAVRATAATMGQPLLPVELRDPPYDYERALSAAGVSPGDGLMVMISPFFARDAGRLAALGLRDNLPAMYAHRAWVDAGGLMSYGVNLPGMFRLAADYVDKVLKGARPADLPVQQPDRFELVANLKTAKALGLTLPPLLLVRADEVIE
jgi:putative ABC transport system substrate-binding protein